MNPIAGPIFVEGRLAAATRSVVTIEDILVRDFRGSRLGLNAAPWVGESTRWPELSNDYTTRIFKHLPGPSGTLRDGYLQFNEQASFVGH